MNLLKNEAMKISLLFLANEFSYAIMNKLLFCVILLAALAFVLSDVNGAATGGDGQKLSSIPKALNYGEYVEKFKKNCSPLEALNKARLFFGRTLKIFQHNVLFAQSKVTYYLNQNQFTDIPEEELKKEYLNNESLNLKPVIEAKLNPNAPASIVVGEAPDDYDVGFSTCDVIGGDEGCDEDHRDATILNFFANQDVDNLSGTIKELRSQPEMAEKIAAYVGIKNDALLEELKTLEEIRKSNMIEKKPVVKSNNDNYDSETISSYGLFSRKQPVMTPENYAKFLLDYELDLTPYPINIDKSSNRRDEKESSHISNLIGSVKGVINFLTKTDFDYDWFDPIDEELTGDNKKEEQSDGSTHLSTKIPPIEYDIDWRKTGCIAKPRTQLSCNSCYAFTTLSLMEYFYCSQTKELTEFSAQYIVDCGSRSNLAGCRGGKIGGVGIFIKKFGLELETLYPYQGKENQCPIAEGDEEKEKRAGYLRPDITHWHNFPEMTAWYKWLPKSPVIVGINMPSDFLAYGGGIHDGLDCSSDMVHALLLVGSGTQDGKKFWLLKNSFSDSWGENGYIRLSKDAPLKCFNTATVVRVKFQSGKS